MDFDSNISFVLKFYVLICFLALFLNYLSNICLNASAERQIKKMREVLFESVLRQDIAYFDKNKFGEINSALIK